MQKHHMCTKQCVWFSTDCFLQRKLVVNDFLTCRLCSASFRVAVTSTMTFILARSVQRYEIPLFCTIVHTMTSPRSLASNTPVFVVISDSKCYTTPFWTDFSRNHARQRHRYCPFVTTEARIVNYSTRIHCFNAPLNSVCKHCKKFSRCCNC